MRTSQRSSASASPAMMIDFALLFVVLMWASTFSLFKIAWRVIDPVAFTALRFALIFLFASGILVLSKRRALPRREDIPALIASGVTGYFLYQMGFVLGLDRTSALASAILISTHPIFSVIIVWFALRKAPTSFELAGVITGFAGVAIFLRAWDAFEAARLGDLLSLGAAAAFGAYGVINQPLVSRIPQRQLMAYGLAVGGLLVTIVGVPAMARQNWESVGPIEWGIFLYAVIGPVYVAYALWNWAISIRGISRTVIYGFLVPVFAGALAVLMLGEPVTPEQVVGGLLVVAGLLVTRASRGVAADPSP